MRIESDTFRLDPDIMLPVQLPQGSSRLRQEDIIDYTRTNIKGEYASLSNFIRKWKASDKKKTIEESFTAMGIDLKALKADQGMEDVDDFDFICYVAYGKKPLTRKERASNVKKKDFFSKYSAEAQAVLGILLDKYMNQGITEVEDIKVLSLADFANFGKPAKIVKLFGGKAQYEAAIRELEDNIYEYNEYYPYSKNFTLSYDEITELQECLNNREGYNLYTKYAIRDYEFYLYIDGNLHTHLLESPGFPNGIPPELEEIFPAVPCFCKIVDILTNEIGNYHFYDKY